MLSLHTVLILWCVGVCCCHRKKQCSNMHEDVHFLQRCFKMLVDDDENTLDHDDALDTIDIDQFTRWVTVLNYGEAPSAEDMDDVVENLDGYREEAGAEVSDGLFEISDFLLLTFDYYLALGCTHMRCIFIDLLLT